MVHLPLRTLPRLWALLPLVAGLLWSCAPEGEGREGEASDEASRIVALGPTDGHDLPATELERVAVGMVAPDFSLETLAGDTLTLSDFRGKQNVLLVFYRGHW